MWHRHQQHGSAKQRPYEHYEVIQKIIRIEQRESEHQRVKLLCHGLTTQQLAKEALNARRSTATQRTNREQLVSIITISCGVDGFAPSAFWVRSEFS